MKSRGIRKQQKESSLFEGRPEEPELLCGRGGFSGRDVFVERRPSRPVKVSMLVRPSGIGPLDCGPGLAVAWSLCRQQKLSGSEGSGRARVFFRDLGTGLSDGARAFLHGRPLPVIPRQVVEGSLESVRLTRDSGVLATKGMAMWNQGQARAMS